MNHRTLIAVIDSNEEAQAVRQELIDAGFDGSNVEIRAGNAADVPRGAEDASDADARREPGFFDRLFGSLDVEEEDAGQYSEAARRGSSLVVVNTSDDDEASKASQIVSGHGAVDMDERVRSWKKEGWKGYDKSAPPLSNDECARERARYAQEPPRGGTMRAQDGGTLHLPVIEEQLRVGKRSVQAGGVRLFSRTTERPVEEEITLREERARVTRHPADREATAAELDSAFEEGSAELRETREEPVVSKRARVVEEIDIDKEIDERTETIRDTVRRSDVEVEDIPASRAAEKPESRPRKRP